MANDPNPIGPPRIAHQFQAWTGPLPQRGTLPPRPPTMVYPERLAGRPKRAHEIPFFVQRPIPVVSLYAGYGSAGAATFILTLQPGARLTFTWSTAVFTSYSGLEQRESLLGLPKRRIEGAAFMRDGSSRDVRGSMMRAAADGATFLLGLPFEELSLSADSAGTVVNVPSTAPGDWIVPAQRVAIVAPDGTTVTAVIQGNSGTQIFLDVAPGAVGRRGARIMPLVQVVLDPQQGFSRYPSTVDLWSIRARATIFGYASTYYPTPLEVMGAAALMTTFTDGPAVPIANVTDDDLLIWDRPNLVEGTAPEAMLSGSEVLDFGALPTGIGGADVPTWSRSLKFESASTADWTWLKAFLRHVRGRQVAWLLSTNRPDLKFVSLTSGGIKVASASASEGGDFVSWFASSAHRRLAIVVSGTVGYYEVQSVTDNLDGTLSLALDISVPGTPTKISFLEQVRFARDEIDVSWNGARFQISETVQVVRDTIDVASRFMFDRIVTLSFAYTGIPPDVPPTTQSFSIPSGGKSYLVNVTSDRTLAFGGIIIDSGSVEATDGMVVCIENNNTGAFAITCNHEDTGIAPNIRRFHNAALTSAGGAGKSVMYRYHGSTQRWIQIM